MIDPLARFPSQMLSKLALNRRVCVVQGFFPGAAGGAGTISAAAAQRNLGGEANVTAWGRGGPGSVAGYALQLLPGSLSLIGS